MSDQYTKFQGFVTVRIRHSTRRQLTRMKGYLELEHGELFTLSDTIDAIILHYALSSNIPISPV
jgi:hypothetical protein